MENLLFLVNWAMYNINAGFNALHYNHLSQNQWAGLAALGIIGMLWSAWKMYEYPTVARGRDYVAALASGSWALFCVLSGFQTAFFTVDFEAAIVFQFVRYGWSAFSLLFVVYAVLSHGRIALVPRWKGDLILRFTRPLFACRLVSYWAAFSI